MFVEIGQAFLQGFHVFFGELVFGDAAVHFERPAGRHQHYSGSVQSRALAFDVEKLFRSQVESEPGFGNHPIRQSQCHFRSDYRVAPMGDVGEGSAVDECGNAFGGLYEVRHERVFQQSAQRAGGV